MLVQSTRFGEITVADKDILTFHAGLPGFPEEKLFAFLLYQPDSPFAFLQSLTNPDLTFMIVEPFTFFADYDFELAEEVVEELGITEENAPQIFNVVRVPEQVAEITVNLAAPIIVNWQKKMAVQYVIDKTTYQVRHPLFPEGLPEQAGKGGK